MSIINIMIIFCKTTSMEPPETVSVFVPECAGEALQVKYDEIRSYDSCKSFIFFILRGQQLQ